MISSFLFGALGGVCFYFLYDYLRERTTRARNRRH